MYYPENFIHGNDLTQSSWNGSSLQISEVPTQRACVEKRLQHILIIIHKHIALHADLFFGQLIILLYTIYEKSFVKRYRFTSKKSLSMSFRKV